MALLRALGPVVLCTALACASQRARPVELEIKPTPGPVPIAAVSAAPAESAPEVTEPPAPTEPFTLKDDLDRAIEVYPPLEPAPHAPLLVFLHATCMQPAPLCDRFGSAARDQGWLVCPSGNSTCYGEPDWHGSGSEKAAFLASALVKVESKVPRYLEEGNGVLIGWSRGAFAARDILYTESPSFVRRFRGLVLIAAQVTPDVARLKKVGIERVVMAAGDYDGARPTMEAAVTKLRAGGIETRWVSLGKIGHAWPADFESRMREPIAWAAK